MLNGLSWLYGKIIDSRNSFYSRQLLNSQKLPAATISIGNLTVGGTGKTPLVKFLAEYLSGKGEEVCIISRGYKRRDESKRVLVSNKDSLVADLEDSGDEPYELASDLLGKCIVIADRNRVKAAEWAARTFDVSVFLLDDAFQHRRAARDLDIVVIDATNPFGDGRLLPAGILRESAAGIARADLAVITRADHADDIDNLIGELKELAPELPVFKCSNRIEGLEPLKGATYPAHPDGFSRSSSVFAFCGIGNPGNFFEHLVRNDIAVAGFKAFGDHHFYKQSDVALIERKCSEAAANSILTTSKDAVKLDPEWFSVPCFVCKNGLRFENRKGFLEIVEKAIQNRND